MCVFSHFGQEPKPQRMSNQQGQNSDATTSAEQAVAEDNMDADQTENLVLEVKKEESSSEDVSESRLEEEEEDVKRGESED